MIINLLREISIKDLDENILIDMSIQIQVVREVIISLIIKM